MATIGRKEVNRNNFVRLRALNNATKSDFPVLELDPIVLFLIVPELTIIAISDTEIQVNWLDINFKVTGFEIERSTNGTDFSLISTTAATAATFTNSGLTTDTTYYFRIRAKNAANYSVYTAIVSAKTWAALQDNSADSITDHNDNTIIIP